MRVSPRYFFGEKPVNSSQGNKRFSCYEIVSTCISAVNLIAIVFLFMQVNQASSSLESAAWQAIQEDQRELNKIFIDNPEMVPYFFMYEPISKEDPLYNQALAVADSKLDFFDSLWGQKEYLEKFKGDSDAWQAWKTYIIASFKLSPLLRERFAQVPCWYDSTFNCFIHKEFPCLNVCPNYQYPCMSWWEEWLMYLNKNGMPVAYTDLLPKLQAI